MTLIFHTEIIEGMGIIFCQKTKIEKFDQVVGFLMQRLKYGFGSYLVERLKSSFRKFYGRYGDLIEQYGVTLSRMLNDILTLDQQ